MFRSITYFTLVYIPIVKGQISIKEFSTRVDGLVTVCYISYNNLFHEFEEILKTFHHGAVFRSSNHYHQGVREKRTVVIKTQNPKEDNFIDTNRVLNLNAATIVTRVNVR